MSTTEPSPGGACALQTITLAGGCFWCTEAVFEQVRGVHGIVSGYANGQRPADRAPTYEEVCTGQTGFAEAVQLQFDPQQIPLQAILRIHFGTHDPTSLNRQGADRGTQYRSAVLVHDAAQQAVVDAVRQEVDAATGGRVVTIVEPLARWYPAEAYHQHYYARHPQQGYCAAVIAPKLAHLRADFARWQRPASPS